MILKKLDWSIDRFSKYSNVDGSPIANGLTSSFRGEVYQDEGEFIILDSSGNVALSGVGTFAEYAAMVKIVEKVYRSGRQKGIDDALSIMEPLRKLRVEYEALPD